MATATLTQERAREVWDDVRKHTACWADGGIANALTENENRAVLAYWRSLSGNSCWMGAFFEFLNCRVPNEGRVLID